MHFGICMGLAAVLLAAGTPRNVLASEPPPLKAEGVDPAVEQADDCGEAARRAGRWQEADLGFRVAWEASGRDEPSTPARLKSDRWHGREKEIG